MKKILKEFQQREADLLHREEYYLQILQEKDTEYNALVKALKDRVRILISSSQIFLFNHKTRTFFPRIIYIKQIKN